MNSLGLNELTKPGEKPILLVFSGGLDSAMVAYYLLSKGQMVDLLYVKMGQAHPHKVTMELASKWKCCSRTKPGGLTVLSA